MSELIITYNVEDYFHEKTFRVDPGMLLVDVSKISNLVFKWVWLCVDL